MIVWLLPGLIGTIGTMFSGRPYPDYSHLTTVLILIVYSLITTFATIVLTVLPSAILIAIAERFRICAWWNYVIGAALLGALGPSMLPMALSWTKTVPVTLGNSAGFAALGAICGLVYWIVAVRGRADSAS
jgi:hypothetical protein